MVPFTPVTKIYFDQLDQQVEIAKNMVWSDCSYRIKKHICVHCICSVNAYLPWSIWEIIKHASDQLMIKKNTLFTHSIQL